MQVYTKTKRLSLKIILGFAVVLFIAYLPASTFFFFIKNDAFNGYFPPKFFMSESIHAGYLPLWNSYINFGIPQYGDMSSGFWSPLTWLIAATVGYNAYTFTLEIFAYIFIGGLAVYKLTGYFNLQNKVRFIAAISYMCCGYNVGHLQHFNWLSGAAFLPLCIWSYLALYKSFSAKNILVCALIFYLFISSAHPGLIIGSIYFFIALAIFLFFKNEKQLSFYLDTKRFLLTNAALILLLLLLSAGMITGYLDIIPNFSRGSKVPLAEALKNPTSFQSWLSFFFPFSTSKNGLFFSTDISMRNIYFSLTLFLFFLMSLFKKKNGWEKFLLFTGISFLLLSAGGVFNTFAYKFFPLINFVRLDGEFVIFSILCFILLASIQLNKFIEHQKKFKGTIQFIYYGIEIFLFACIAFGLYKTINTKASFLYSFQNISQQNSISQKLKLLIDSISFYDTLWLQGIIQLLILWGIKFCIRQKKWNLLSRIVIADMVIATLLNLPFTGVGMASVADVQRVLDQSPNGIPIPNLHPVIKNDTINLYEKGLVGDWSFYNKQIGVSDEVAYPIRLKNINTYFQKIRKDSSVSFIKEDFIFCTNINAKPEVTFFSANKIALKISTADTCKMVYQQAFYPHWFYKTKNEIKPVQQFSTAFMSAPLAKGENEMEFIFDPKKVKIAMLISLIIFSITCLLLLFNPSFIRKSLYPS